MSSLKSIFLIILSSSLLAISSAYCQEEQVDDLRSGWLIYSEDESGFLPYIEELHAPNALHFPLDLNRYKEYHIQMSLPSNVSVLFDHNIVFVNDQTAVLTFGVDSLQNVFGQDLILVSLYAPALNPSDISTTIIDKNPVKSGNAGNTNYDLVERKTDAITDFYIVSIFIVLMVVLICKRALKNSFNDYFSLFRALSLKPKSEGIFSVGIFSSTNILMLLMYGIMLGFTFVIIDNVYPIAETTAAVDRSFGALLLQSFLVSLIASVLMVLKYFLISFVGSVFKLKKVLVIQFFDYFRLTLMMALILFCLAIIYVSVGQDLGAIMWMTIATIVLIMLILRPLLMFLKLNKLSGYKNLHLISYICGTEIIPLIIIVKIFLN
ncbi:MAG: DUF4271 domain-containing protein [Cyclobacteriaceae bacterium]